MSKKPAKRKTVREQVTAAEVGAQREAATLRRVREQQRRIVQLAREVRHAVRRADLARIEVARELVAGTEWGVFGIAEWDFGQKRVEELSDANVRLTQRVVSLEGMAHDHAPV